MSERAQKAQSRLEIHEKGYQKNKAQTHKLGKLTPDEAVVIPKIGEWNLNHQKKELDPKELDILNKPVDLGPLSPLKNAPPISTIVDFNPKKVRKHGNVSKLFRIKPPPPVTEPLISSSFAPISYPAGTITSDLNQIIHSKQKIAPERLPPLQSERDLKPEEVFLPIEIFDNENYTQYSLDELLKNPDAFSKYTNLNGGTTWEPCKVISYDEDSNLFTIEWNKSKKRKRVSRYNVRFAIEDEELFKKRIADAKNSCHEYEMKFRFEERIKHMPIEGLPSLPPESMERIVSNTNCFSRDAEPLFISLENEIENDYKLNNNKLDFEYSLTFNELIPDRDDFLKLINRKRPNTKYGLKVKASEQYHEYEHSIMKEFPMNNSNIHYGMLNIWQLILEQEDTKFLNGGYSDLLTLDSFVSQQFETLSNNSKAFRGSIQEKIEAIIGQSFSDELITERNKAKPLYIKMIETSVRMLNQLIEGITHNSLVNYVTLFEKHTIENADFPPQFLIDLMYEPGAGLSFIPPHRSFKSQVASLLTQLESTISDVQTITVPIIEYEATQVFVENSITEIHESIDILNEHIDSLYDDLNEWLEGHKHLEKTLILGDDYGNTFDPEGTKTIEEYSDIVVEIRDVINTLIYNIDDKIQVGVFFIQCKSFTESMTFHMNEVLASLFKRMKELALKETNEMQNSFQMIMEKLSFTPTTPEELHELKEFANQITESIPDRAKRIKTINTRFDFLEENGCEVSNEECDQRYQLLMMPNKLTHKLDDATSNIQVGRIKMIQELKENQRILEKETMAIVDIIPGFVEKYNDLEFTIDAIDQVHDIDAKLIELKKQMAKYASHEQLFGYDPMGCRVLTKLCDDFAPLSILWNLAHDWTTAFSTWMDTPFPQLKPDQMTIFIGSCVKKASKLKRDLSKYPVQLKNVLTPLAEQIDKFRQPLQLISKLRHPGIKTKHWEQIAEVVGFDCQPTMETTLHDFLNMDLGRWGSKIAEIAGIAMKEYLIESTLDQMDQELQTKVFNTQEFRETGQLILVDIDDIISTVDDQLVTTQTLFLSPFIGPVKVRVQERLDLLKHSKKTIDIWIQCQQQWLYLQPIFSGGTIQKKLPRESSIWQQVDKKWAGTMTLTRNHPDFSNVMHRDKIYETLLECNQLLESVAEGLNKYLETKRHAFPRFFFLSNDELINILSHTKEFDEINKSMRKLFEYIARIEVDEELIISSMDDDGLESVQLVNKVDGNTAEIEDWLNIFEEEMKNTIKENIREAMSQYPKKRRDQWIEEFPAQVILITNQIMFTQQVTQMIRTQKRRGIRQLHGKYIETLELLTAMVRRELTPDIRMIVSCLLINEVHNRDIINWMAEQGVEDIEDFKWEKQLRYYWQDETVIVKSINNNYEYSYEYAGNSSRLVITPLTDRCYQTLLSAFKQNLSAAPSGPAGTGKTETVRDCSKALGRPCVVYNCSEEVTPEQMSQFFAGLATSGSWSCFDEFNRINIEVLSVIAQQLRCIQNAIAAGVETFVLDQRQLKLNPNTAVCITMNPGYSGRTELPDNLKALFRPCAMMVPDFVFICEILLFSGGFVEASVLSRKLVALFDLCRTILTNEHHYDWGMRTMKTILNAAAIAKHNNLRTEESILLVDCTRSCILPRLIKSDVPLFENIITDVFPGVENKVEDQEELKQALVKAFKEEHGEPIPAMIQKCFEINQTTQMRHGSMLVGGAMSGKTTCWRSLQRAMNSIGKEVKTYVINPKAISISELYGLFDPITMGWADGVLSSKIRSCSVSDEKCLHWIILDGPVDSLWIESMNSLLDDNKVLCLPNNERINLGPNVKLIFEVTDLTNASPASVSRCGMVYFDTEYIQYDHIVEIWCNERQEQYPLVTSLVRKLSTLYLPKMIQFVTNDGKMAIKSNPNFLVHSMLEIIDSFLDVLRKPVLVTNDEGDMVEKDPLEHSIYCSEFNPVGSRTFGFIEMEKIPLLFERVFLFAVVWSFGASLVDQSRNTFDKFFRDTVESLNSKYPFPPKFTVFDYYLDVGRFSWMIWCDSTAVKPMNVNNEIEKIYVPTNETTSSLFFLRLMSYHHKHMLMIGPETSKTLLVNTLMDTVMDQRFDTRNITLSSITSSSTFHQTFKSFLQKRHGAWGPLTNQQLVVFIDHLNAVRPEEFGAQPPIELLRQFFDYGGWYDTKHIEFQKVVDTTIISAMDMPDGGMYSIPHSLLRHFYFQHIPKFSKSGMNSILLAILQAKMEVYQKPIKDLARSIIAATLDMHEAITEQLLPVPTKPHFIFGLRKMVKVVKSMLLVPQETIESDTVFMRLWYHEMNREYVDSFNLMEDREWFGDKLSEVFHKNFRMSVSSITTGVIRFNNLTRLDRSYVECTERADDLLTRCKTFLEENNHEVAKPLDIVMFQEASEHLASIVRVLNIPRGHMMLVGYKSSGRKSLTRLAQFIMNMELFEVNLTRNYGRSEWKDDLKDLMRMCGQKNQQTVFYIQDTQIIHEFQLEDLSNLLTDSWIPNLYDSEEIDRIKSEMSIDILEDDVWKLFMERVKKNLHLVLIFSPAGQIFKEAMHYFPALRNETTIDWFMPWSSNALEQVAEAILRKSNITDKKSLDLIIDYCVQVHTTSHEESAKYLNETKRHVSITVSRFFELLSEFTKRLSERQLASDEQVRSFDNGIEKIEATREQIEQLSHQLDRDIPILKDKQRNVEDLIKNLQNKAKECELMKEEVKEQSVLAEREAMAAADKNKIAQLQLAEAKPILIAAQNAVESMDKDSLVNIKTLKKIHPALRETFEAICIIFGKQPRKVDVDGVKEDDYWPETLSLLNDVQFVKKIKMFDPEKLSKETIKKLAKYVSTDKAKREIKLNEVKGGYNAVGHLYFWVCSIYDYWNIFQLVLPRQKEADIAAAKLAEQNKILDERKAHLHLISQQLDNLQAQVDAEKVNVKNLQDSVSLTQLKLSRAQRIMNGLSGEANRWNNNKTELLESNRTIMADTLLISSCLIYLGGFGPRYRTELIEKWKQYLSIKKCNFQEKFSITQMLGNNATIRSWIVAGLPNDNHSIENALIISNSNNTFPLLIDPQYNGTRWLKFVEQKIVILRFDQNDFVQSLKGCIQFGNHVLIENVGLKFDPLIEPILSREFSYADGVKKVNIGGEYIPYSDDFRLYLSTKYPNPNFSPEICSQVSLINFSTTQIGLTDLLMNSLIEVERDDLDKKRVSTMEVNASNLIKLKEIESEILHIVSTTSNDILSDDSAINTLTNAQKTSAVIEQQMAISAKTEAQIQQFRQKFIAVAERAALLYFCASDFSVIDPMYQFSLSWFVDIFKKAIQEAEHPSEHNALVSSIKESITVKFFQSVSLSLFAKHKLLFAFLVTIRILFAENIIGSKEVSFLLSPNVRKRENKTISYISDEAWGLVSALVEASEYFKDLISSLSDQEAWRAYMNSTTPEQEKPPYKKDMSAFHRLLLLRVFHLHRVTEGMRIFIEEALGSSFVSPPSLNLSKIFKESSPMSPIIFVITPGIDPQDEIMQVAESLDLGRYLKPYSLGRGRGPGAEELIQEAAESGFWVLLQNCHLSLSWMPRLESIVANLNPRKMHDRFRLCLVTMSSPEFPIGVLFRGTKLIYEIPKGIRENMLRIYSGFNADSYNENENSLFKLLTFHLAFFHAVVLERLQYGSLGWNIPYEFNPSDFSISHKNLSAFLSEAGGESVPYDSLLYVIGELNYGGRVTDVWDRRLLLALLKDHFSEEIQDTSIPIIDGLVIKDFSISYKEIEDEISKINTVTNGRDVGLSDNAHTISSRNTALMIFDSILSVQSTLIAPSSDISEEEFELTMVENLRKEVPKPLNVHNLKRFKEDGIGAFLRHEVTFYNNLIEVITSSLMMIQKSLNGFAIIDQSHENALRSIVSNKVPLMWLSVSYPSILNLRDYINDLIKRCSFVDSWLRNGQPTVYKLGMLFHPEEFLTVAMQIFARKHSVAFDSLSWSSKVINIDPSAIKEDPPDGIYISGLFLEGALLKNDTLMECGQMDLISELPVIQLLPVINAEKDPNLYECPVFRTQSRGTGALDLPNYILSLYLAPGEQSTDHWIQRSVAAFITVHS